jgi:aldehyde:ferredoxin oxidoreductase
MTQGGYMGKILRVNLTTKMLNEERLPQDEVLRKFLGCYGLGLWFLYKEYPFGIRPTDPRCPLIFFTGPLTGSHIPGGNNLTAVSINFDTGFTAGRSHTHGFFGPRLKFAGYDGIIITGRADRPVYLWVHDETAEIREASNIWGRDTHETEDLVKKDIGQTDASVAAIGPAGENLCAGALIENDKNHSMAHSGIGAIMGSKNLKAIAVSGNKKFPSVNPEKEREIAKRWREVQRSVPWTHTNQLKDAGIIRSDYQHVLRRFGIAYKNMQPGKFPTDFGQGFSKNKITPRTCYGCHIACTYDVEVTSGPHMGYIATLAGGGESIEGAAAMVGITEPGTIFYLVDLYDRLGIEASTAGCAISMAFEAFERGLITKEDTDGLELRWGDAEVVEKVVRKYVSRDGFGDILARGPKEAAEIIGGNAPEFAIHIKGSGMNLHDWRGGWGALLGQILSSGSGWFAPGADIIRPDPEAGYAEPQPPLTVKGKADEVRRTAINKYINDSIGCCWFHTWGNPDGNTLAADAISAVTGWDINKEELLELGERILQLERAFNIRCGLVPEDDYKVPKRVTEAPTEGPAKGRSIAPYLRGMVMEYYELVGWDKKTGKPWRDTLERVGLEDVAKDLWG